ncbi:ferric iron reductase [Plantactinospora sp. BB1]|uniref:ferric iron reductase n=1 Tax=Plantactinospora sp. BB1 TaxID=2071627 RepID=UPI000D179C72|nr:ferric iron reductase [Plantactinospora sp. BB1]
MAPSVVADKPATAGVLAPTIRLMPRLHGRTGPEQVAIAEPLVVTDVAGWLPAVGLVAGAGLERLLSGKVRTLRVPLHVSAVLTWKAYTYWLTLPAVAGYLSSRRVPVLSAGNMLVRVSRREPWVVLGMRNPLVTVLATDPSAGAGATRVVPDEAVLLRTMREAIVERHLRPLALAVCDLTRIGERPLRGGLANAVARHVQRAPGLAGEEALATAGTLLRALGVEDLVRLDLTGTGALRVRRRTCCMAFTVSGLDPCESCALRWSRSVQRPLDSLGG